MVRKHYLVPVTALLLGTACMDCGPVTGSDAGPRNDAGASTSSSGGGGDGGSADGSVPDGGSACGPNTPGFGEACGDCGHKACRNGELTCLDPGKNACNACGPLDLSGGIVGRDCGTCGVVGCADGGMVTECQGEHPPNACGGCLDLPLNEGPPDAGCSSCGTGTWNCGVLLNDLICVRGRATNACGSCDRCIQYHADMEDLSDGQFILGGTRALIEDVGEDPDLGTFAGQTQILTFEPLISTLAGLVLEEALVYLSPTENHADPGAFALAPYFSNHVFLEPGDAIRQYPLYPLVSEALPTLHWVIIYDGFLNRQLARGRLLTGPPPG